MRHICLAGLFVGLALGCLPPQSPSGGRIKKSSKVGPESVKAEEKPDKKAEEEKPVLPAPSGKDDWLLFRRTPQQTGVTPTTVPNKLVVLWTFKAEDSFESAVAVSRGVVYAGSMDEHLYAVNLKDGKQKWKYKAGPFKAPPAVRGGLVYVGDLDGILHCVDGARGTKKWTFEAGAEAGGVNFHGDDVLFASHDENLYCLTRDGKQRWKFRTEGQIYGSVSVAEGKTFLVGCDSKLHVIDIAKGKELHSVDLGGQTAATAAVRGDKLYVGTMRNQVKAIDWKKGEEVWTYRPDRQAQAFYASAAVNDKYVVIGNRDNRVHCIDRKKGEVVWTFPTGNKVDSSPVIAGSRVVVGSLDGKVYVLDLASGKEVTKVTLDGPISAAPVVVGGKVLIGTQKGTLYCLGAQ
jgi:outer membrane protein assembly factor BamB